jgi:hypothetical protein
MVSRLGNLVVSKSFKTLRGIRTKKGFALTAIVFFVLAWQPLGPNMAWIDEASGEIWLFGGYGWIPFISWSIVFLVMIRFWPTVLKRNARNWIASFAFLTAIFTALSMFRPDVGILSIYGYGGWVGQLIGGDPVLLSSGTMMVYILAMLFLLAPKWTSSNLKRLFLFISNVIWNGVRRTFIKGNDLILNSMKLFSNKTHSDNITTDIENPGFTGRLTGAVSAIGFGKKMPKKGADSFYITQQKPSHEQDIAKEMKSQKWILPDPELLFEGQARSMPQEILGKMSRIIEETLANHGVQVSVEDVRVGPRVIRFGIVPGWIRRYGEASSTKLKEHQNNDALRVKVQSILAREQDLALALKTADLRIEAPVPGEGLIGLEVPNPSPSRVYLRSITEHSTFKKISARGGVPISLGKGTGGEPVTEDLLSLPHLLIAGATGSGKSVCVNAIITSVLMANRPDRLRMIMVDPKRVELTPFNGLPHLLKPVIVDTEKVLPMLGGLMKELFRRYKLMEEQGVRNIEGYNKKAKEQFPYLLLVVDELADLMMSARFEVEQSLVRLAQLGRATGIHLILCTQRPSVNVVTGLLKANIAARVAFAVSSQIDSRVILDGAGAEKLLGKGDLLFLSAQSPKPQRIQGAFMFDEEIERIVHFWRDQEGPALVDIDLDETQDLTQSSWDVSGDELLEKARSLAEHSERISPSLLQRRLQIGYAKAVDLMEALEAEDIVSDEMSDDPKQVF